MGSDNQCATHSVSQGLKGREAASHDLVLKILALIVLSVLTVLFVAHAQDNFRGPIIPSYHIGGHHKVGACCPGQAKVKDLKSAV
jgi:hypothetical protein